MLNSGNALGRNHFLQLVGWFVGYLCVISFFKAVFQAFFCADAMISKSFWPTVYLELLFNLRHQLRYLSTNNLVLQCFP